MPVASKESAVLPYWSMLSCKDFRCSEILRKPPGFVDLAHLALGESVFQEGLRVWEHKEVRTQWNSWGKVRKSHESANSQAGESKMRSSSSKMPSSCSRTKKLRRLFRTPWFQPASAPAACPAIRNKPPPLLLLLRARMTTTTHYHNKRSFSWNTDTCPSTTSSGAWARRGHYTLCMRRSTLIQVNKILWAAKSLGHYISSFLSRFDVVVL